MSTINQIVYSFDTKHKQGFTTTELEQILTKFPKLDRRKFNDAMNGSTGIILDGDFILYHNDIIKAINVSLYGISLRIYEWD